MVRDEVYRSGIMWKRPWPLEERRKVYDVSLRSLWLTAKVVESRCQPVVGRIAQDRC